MSDCKLLRLWESLWHMARALALKRQLKHDQVWSHCGRVTVTCLALPTSPQFCWVKFNANLTKIPSGEIINRFPPCVHAYMQKGHRVTGACWRYIFILVVHVRVCSLWKHSNKPSMYEKTCDLKWVCLRAEISSAYFVNAILSSKKKEKKKKIWNKDDCLHSKTKSEHVKG